MRRWLPLLAGCGLVFNAGVLAALYSPAASYAQSVSVVSFLVAFLTLGSAFLLLNGGRLGRIPQQLVWGTLGVLPRWAKAGLALLFVVTIAQTLISQTGVQSDRGFDRNFATIAVWLSAVGTALHYGMQLDRDPSPGLWSSRILPIAFVVIGAGLALAMFQLGRDPIEDETATHDRLSAQFGAAAWRPHLVAANTYHGAFVVYLDTRDATVQADACTDLKPVAAELGRDPDLYYATRFHGRFSRTC